MSLKFHVIGGDNAISRLFLDYGLTETSFKDSELMIFTGGADVSPQLYDEKPIQGTSTDEKRDEYEMNFYYDGIKAQKKAIGICRGAQFLHVLNGYPLWQDINNHAIGGATHLSVDIPTGDYVETSSCHHQMMRVDNISDPLNAFKVICTSQRSTRRSSEKMFTQLSKDSKDQSYRDDIEVLWYPFVRTLCYQGHPEYRKKECTLYFTRLLHRFEIISPECATQFYKKHYSARTTVEEEDEASATYKSWVDKMYPLSTD